MLRYRILFRCIFIWIALYLKNINNFRAKILKIHVTQNTPIFGSLLRTTCSLDEVCLTDSVPEAGERYPNSQFEVLIDTTRPPKLTINESNDFYVYILNSIW